MTTGQIIKGIIKKRNLTQVKVARIAGVEPMYVSKVISNTLKKGKAFDAIIKALDVPYQVIVFKSLTVEEITNPAQKRLMEKLLSEMIEELDLVFDCKID